MRKTVIRVEGLQRTKAWVQTVKAMAEAVEEAVQVAQVMTVAQGVEVMTATMEEVKATKTDRSVNLCDRLPFVV